jgi:hypothetical protein
MLPLPAKPTLAVSMLALARATVLRCVANPAQQARVVVRVALLLLFEFGKELVARREFSALNRLLQPEGASLLRKLLNGACKAADVARKKVRMNSANSLNNPVQDARLDALQSAVRFGGGKVGKVFGWGHGATLAFLLVFSSGISTAFSIGNEATATTPASANYSGIVNDRPGSGETVYLNPPVFSWIYVTNIATASSDRQYYEFQFQVSTSSAFSTFLVNQRTPVNLFNYLAPFTNADGSTYTNTLYWRRLYVGTNGLTNFVSVTNTFTVAAAATNWNRARMLEESYVTNRSHPFVLFNSANRGDVLRFVQTNNVTDYNTIVSHAQAATNATWWTNEAAWDTNNTALTPRALNLGAVLLLSALNTNQTAWTNRLVDNYQRYVNYFMGANRWTIDYGNGDQPYIVRAVALGYDWLYDRMNSLQRSNALYALERVCRYSMRSGVFWKGTNESGSSVVDYTGEWVGPYLMPWYSNAKNGSSHASMVNNANAVAALAAFPDDDDAREFLDHWLQYMIAKGTPYGGFAVSSLPRTYAYANYIVSGLIWDMTAYHSVFPEMGLTNTPWLRAFADWFARIIPPGYVEYHAEWGDTGQKGRVNYWAYYGVGRDLGLLTKDGNVWRHHTNEARFAASSVGSWDFLANVATLWPPPAQLTNDSAKLFIEDGAVVASSLPANDIGAFTNGVGVIFQARPRGNTGNHNANADGSFEMWAYGSKVTDAGGYNLEAFGYGAAAYNGLFIGGQGVQNHALGSYPLLPLYGKIVAYTNGSGFTFWSGDLTASFTNASNPTTSVARKVRRNMLFVSNSFPFLVIFDEIQTSAPRTNQWLFHVREATATNISSVGFRFSSTNQVGQNISNHVFFATSGLTVSNMTGSNVLRNPVTGVWTTDSSDPTRRAHALWYYNTGSNFLSVIYPARASATQPSFTRLSDYSVAITNGSEGHVFTFIPTNNAIGIEVIFEAGSSGSGGGPGPSTPRRLRVSGGARAQMVTPP